MKRLILIFTIIGFSYFELFAVLPVERKIRLTDNWEFLKSDLGGIWEAVRPGGGSEKVPIWEKVNLPHCFNAEDAVDPDINYYQGPGWYRTNLTLENPYSNGRILIELEGAGQKTDVYVYTKKLKSHVGGYDSWYVDITDAVRDFLNSKDAERFKDKVPLVIRCDNSRDLEMIPSDLSDFNLYGGLYRYVNLIYLPEVSIENFEVNSALDKNLKKANLSIKGLFYNPQDIKNASVEISLREPSGKKIMEKVIDILPLGEKLLLEVEIKNPILWDIDNPELYRCEVVVKANSNEIKCVQNFGFRYFEFVENGPFKLNGRRVLLKGTHRHEDHAGVGAAMTEEQMIQEMRMMKEMGVNFIRLGHYPQSPVILNQCDSLGILVWEEIPWCRGGLGGEDYQTLAKNMLARMIEEHRNHPSVIIWGLGNENDWPNDFPEFSQSDIRAFMSELNDLSHRLDPERKTAIRRCEFCKDIVDVYSPTMWAGWYSGNYREYRQKTESAFKQVKHLLHVEWGGDSHPGRHIENFSEDKIKNGPRDGQWSETYIVRLVDWHLKEQENMPFITGAAYWPFKDFSTPVRPENPVPYVNQKGVVERDLTKKETYYVFQSYWTETPMIHIYGHSWPVRYGKENEEKEILVYSNCEEVELFVNGVSQGKKKRNSQDFPAAGLRWNVILNKGENKINAIGRKKKQEIADEIKVTYQTENWTKPANVQVNVTPVEEGLVKVETKIVDDKGIHCLDAKNFIRFEIAGDGELIKNQGTQKGSAYVGASNGYASILVRTNGGRSVVAVKSDKLPTQHINISMP